jgi:hypothetical protein
MLRKKVDFEEEQEESPRSEFKFKSNMDSMENQPVSKA